MKVILPSIFILFISFGIQAQSDKVDSLIDKLDNNQLYGTCNFSWELEMESDAAYSLIEIGKSVSDKLKPLLDSSDKGIIAHYILSNIWMDSFTTSSSFENFDAKGIVEYTYNGLSFYEKDGKMIAEKKVLIKNKKYWKKKLKK